MSSQISIPVKNLISLDLKYLPGYAQYLLDNKLREFVEMSLENARPLNIPMLKFFESLPHEELVKMSMESNRRLLTALSNNKALQYIETSKLHWINNQLPVINRDQVILEDITLVNYIRRQTFRDFLPAYSYSMEIMQQIMDEVDKFTASLDVNLFDGYVTIQQEKLRVAHATLQKKEKQLLEAQAISHLGSFEWDFTGKESSYTPEVFKIFEFDQTSNLEAFLDDVHPDDRVKVRNAIQGALATGDYECEYRYLRNNKNKVLWSKGKVTFDNGKAMKMTGTIMDVTEKHAIINKLKENEALSKQAQALTHTGNWTWLVDSNEILWSDEMYRIYGLEPQSEKITFERFAGFIHADDHDRRMTEINKALDTRVVEDYIMRIINPDGKEKVLRGRGQVVVKDNRVMAMIGTCQDITLEFRLTRELESKNEALLRKNKELEAFNFIASHDLQEPLRKIQVYSKRVEMEGAGKMHDTILNYFTKISTASNQMQKMIEDFLLFSQAKQGDLPLEPVDLKKLLEEVRKDLAGKIEKSNTTIDVSDLPLVGCVEANVKQVFKELISNAIKFRKKLTPLEITITSERITGQDGKAYIGIAVKDNGIGFESKYATRIFDLFQRLHSKDEYSGSGIGLALCKKIMEDHHGWIEAESRKDIGSAFQLYFPADAGAATYTR